MIKNESIRNNRLIRHTFYFLNAIARRGRLLEKAKEIIACFDDKRATVTEPTPALLKDMLRMYARNGYSFAEYLLYSFFEKPLKERLQFIADWEHLGYACAMNDHKNDELFDDKWKTYQTFRRFYGRDMAICTAAAGEADYRKFVSEHPEFVVKPLDASCGKGVQVVRDGKTLQYADIRKEISGDFIVEELIRQVHDTAKFHPASLNTVRVPTIRTGETVHYVHPFFRIGQHGNTVDNAGAGGIICAVNPENGCVIAAADEAGRRFEVHPDSGEQIIGFYLPMWEEAKAFTAELTKVLPDNHYTGWDLALTESGWVLVEGNRRGQFVWQIPLQKGSRDEIEGYLRALRVRY